MKEFIAEETKKALARLWKSLIFIAQRFFILTVNLLFWILPMMVLAYFTLKPLVSRMVSGRDSSFEELRYCQEPQRPERLLNPFSDLSRIPRLLDFVRRIGDSFRDR